MVWVGGWNALGRGRRPLFNIKSVRANTDLKSYVFFFLGLNGR